MTGATIAGSRRALATRSRPTWPCSHSQSKEPLCSVIPSRAAAAAKAECTSPGATEPMLARAPVQPELVLQRLCERRARTLAALAVEGHVDQLVEEGDEPRDGRRLRQRVLAGPGQVLADLEREVRGMPLVGARRALVAGARVGQYVRARE